MECSLCKQWITWLKESTYEWDAITVFTVFRLLTDFVCLYTYEFWLSFCKIVRKSRGYKTVPMDGMSCLQTMNRVVKRR